MLNDGLPVLRIPFDGKLDDIAYVVWPRMPEIMRCLTLAACRLSAGWRDYRVDQLARVEIISAPQEIRRIGGQQALSIQLRPHEGLPLKPQSLR